MVHRVHCKVDFRFFVQGPGRVCRAMRAGCYPKRELRSDFQTSPHEASLALTWLPLVFWLLRIMSHDSGIDTVFRESACKRQKLPLCSASEGAHQVNNWGFHSQNCSAFISPKPVKLRSHQSFQCISVHKLKMESHVVSEYFAYRFARYFLVADWISYPV